MSNVAPFPLGFELSDKSDQIHLYDRSGAETAAAAYSSENPWPELADGFGLTLERHPDGLIPDAAASFTVAGCVGSSPGRLYMPCPESSLLSEINYHSSMDADAGDWIELHNTSTGPLDLSGWQLRDDDDTHVYVFPNGTVISPDEPYHVFYQDETKFSVQFPAVTNKTGPIGFGFNSSKDLIRIYTPDGRLYLSMRYGVASPWAVEADGGGYTLEKPDFSGLVHDPSNWLIGCPGGTPAAAYDPDCNNVGINELAINQLAISAWPNPAHEQLFIHVKILRMPGLN